jgi:hypothetical protein
MVFLSTLDHKSYWQELAAGIPEVRCPNPSCSRCLLRGHGWYRRYLGGRRVAFRRTRCPCCGVTHALLPEDVCAYQDLTLSALELAMEAASPTPAARAVGSASVAAVRRARRWFRGTTWAALDPLLTGPGRLLDRLVTLVGKAPGKLLRLRRWLWSKAGLLLGGLSGLFLHGRPCRQLLYIDWDLLNALCVGHSS